MYGLSAIRKSTLQHERDNIVKQHDLPTGGAVAGIMAGTALVGIGAVALTGGAVLNAVDFPRSPRQVQKMPLCVHLFFNLHQTLLSGLIGAQCC